METFKSLVHRYRRVLIVGMHVGLVVFSNLCAFLLRFDGRIPQEHWQPLMQGLPWLVGLRLLTFWRFRLYQGLWRYVSLWDLQNIVIASISSGLAFALAVAVFRIGPYPRSIFIVDVLILMGLMAGTRLVRRFYRDLHRPGTEKRVLVMGAGDAGALIVRDMKSNRQYESAIVGFIDDDPRKVGRSIHGIEVLGTRSDLASIIAREQPQEVLVAIPSAEPAQIRAIVKSLERFKIPIKTLPRIRDILDGRVEVSQIRSLSFEDLMSRPMIGLDSEPTRQLINGRRVLVTGAGGSIGSELSRQIAALGPARLLVLDRYENSLFDLCNDLDARHPACVYQPIIADVTDRQRIESLFADTQPELVFHAAAHKHVPLMEHNPCEAIKNNVRGTRIVAEAAARYGALGFVLISTDKAVNPSSVMGATKRVAELVVRAIGETSATQFAAVRFGNVLGSNGSVSRVFSKQIASGGPVTVTHPQIRRFFMLIPEAVQLVVHAASLRASGSIFVLDMGEPIRIQDLARNIIRLSGFVPDEEIQVQFTGLRPGEKLFEELVEAGETVQPSGIEQIMRVTSAPLLPQGAAVIAKLEEIALAGLERDALATLAEIVPTFVGVTRHTNHPSGV